MRLHMRMLKYFGIILLRPYIKTTSNMNQKTVCILKNKVKQYDSTIRLTTIIPLKTKQHSEIGIFAFFISIHVILYCQIMHLNLSRSLLYHVFIFFKNDALCACS